MTAGALNVGLAGCSGGGSIFVPSAGTSLQQNVTGTHTPAADTALITILRSQQTGAIPPMLGGLSFEKDRVPSGAFSASSSDFIACLRLLGPSVIRFGGISVDETMWVPTGAGNTHGEIAPSDVTNLAAFASSAGWKVLYGINLATNTPALAASEAAFAVRALGENLYGFEIGNEPDDYPYTGMASSNYSEAEYLSEWSTIAAAVKGAAPGIPLIGPDSASDDFNWTSDFASAESARVQSLSQHYYIGNSTDASASMTSMLTPNPIFLTQLQKLNALSKQTGLSFRIGECNSYAEKGLAGVSNAFGSALWAIDVLMSCALNGALGVNFHGGGEGPTFTPIADNNGIVTELRPEYYAMLFVSQIASGVMYNVNVTSEILMSAYAVDGNDGATYLVLLNKDPAQSVSASISLGANANSAKSLLLVSSGLAALSGTTLGGNAVGLDGTWTPNPSTTIAVHASSMVVQLPAASATLLKIS